MFRTGIAVVVCAAAGTVRADDALDVRKEIQAQIDLIKKGDTDELKKHFTERLRANVTPDAVKAAAKKAADIQIDDLAAKIEVADAKIDRTAVVTMKNGRKLTTFVHKDGRWLADTIWFK